MPYWPCDMTLFRKTKFAICGGDASIMTAAFDTSEFSVVLCSIVILAGPLRNWNNRPCAVKIPTLTFSMRLLAMRTFDIGTAGDASGCAARLMAAATLRTWLYLNVTSCVTLQGAVPFWLTDFQTR